MSEDTSISIVEMKRLRKEHDYRALGAKLWEAFLSLPDGRKRRAVSRFWSTLSKAEKQMCEEV